MTHSWGNTELTDGQTDSWTDRQWRFNRTLHKTGVQYSDMVTRLFTFTVTTYSKKWKFHLHALKDDKCFCTRIYCINYRPLSAVYTADMKSLERNDMAKWDCFMEGNICSQKNDIPWYPMATAGGKTKYWKDKAECPVNQATQATKQLLLHNWSYWVANILRNAESWKESNSKSNYHHQLGNTYTLRQHQWMKTLLHTLKIEGLFINMGGLEHVL